MTGERKLADFRWWTLGVLGLLSAEPDRQAEYLQASGVGADEILLQFDDVLHVARARVGDRSLSHEEYILLQSINGHVDAVSAAPESIWTVAALEERVEWRELRAAARAVKASLERYWSQDSDMFS
ncbi:MULTISPECIES: hypothetical protein [unclassified Streptomyces]|uniref:hypothetical protein n=1 Tax=unclassified Streptomyces TaxID=2593676 RepID=UPI00114D19DE|nr:MULTISPECIES: hypothetical protein [unclassified Streptomyces]MYR25468.1 hypothetical protein [Streptomyces sp. SID4945]